MIATIDVSGLPEDLPLGNIRLNLAIRHTWRGDLKVELFAPGDRSAPSFVVADGEGGSQDDIVIANQPLSSPVFAASGSNEGSLNPNGTWRLVILDRGNGDQGVLENFSLKVITGAIVPQPPSPPPAPVLSGVYIGTYSVDQGGQGVFAFALDDALVGTAILQNTAEFFVARVPDTRVSADGSFTAYSNEGDVMQGTVDGSAVTGVFSNPAYGVTGSFYAARTSNSGAYAAGTYSGDITGQFPGQAHAIAAADGRFSFYLSFDDGFLDASFGEFVNNSYTGLLTDGSVVTLNFNPADSSVTGTYSYNGVYLGDVRLARMGSQLPRGDFTGDGKPDILWRHGGNGGVHVWEMNGTAPVRGINLPAVGDLGWQVGGVGDFTGDGKADILWRHGGNGGVHVWEMNGTAPVRGINMPAVGDLGWQVANN